MRLLSVVSWWEQIKGVVPWRLNVCSSKLAGTLNNACWWVVSIENHSHSIISCSFHSHNFVTWQHSSDNENLHGKRPSWPAFTRLFWVHCFRHGYFFQEHALATMRKHIGFGNGIASNSVAKLFTLTQSSIALCGPMILQGLTCVVCGLAWGFQFTCVYDGGERHSALETCKRGDKLSCWWKIDKDALQ